MKYVISKIEDTSKLSDVFFEDIDAIVSTKQVAYEVKGWYILYFSTRKNAEKFLESKNN